MAMFLAGALLSMPVRSPAQGSPRIEASFNIPGLATDPFDYTVTDVRVQIVQPDSTTLSLPAFFDGGTTWRVRHAPLLAGLYQITGVTLNGSPPAVNNLQPTSWTVGGPPNPGFVRIDPSNPSRFITDNGRRFFPAGHNLAWSATSANANLLNIIPKMGPAHENWGRVWMTHFYDWQGQGLNLDWPKVGGTFGQLSLTVASNWDSIVTAAEQNGIRFQMVLQHHGQYSQTVDPNWADNPYNTANGGFLSSPEAFFTDATAKALTKRKYRYIIARWGSSPAVMAWELFNEVQFTAAAQAGQWSLVGAWHDEMAQFIRSQDAYQHLITTSSDLNQPIWNQCDYFQHHDYPVDLIGALRDPQGVPNGQPVKPVFGGECGTNGVPHLGVNAPLWAGLMSAQSGNAQPWYWDGIDAANDYISFRAAGDFVRRAGIPEQDSLAKSAPHVTCPVNSALVFGLGGGFAPATQDTFAVGDVAPDGAGTAPPYLQSQNGHPGWTPNGYTFNVNYPVAGTFAVQITQISASGGTLQILRDGVMQTNVAFPGTGSLVNTNVTFPVNVPAGAHSVKLFNPGNDWLLLGNITLNPYVPMLGAYQIGNTNFAALWFWHRTNVYNPGATATVSGTFPLSGLAAGDYAATWWDTFAGGALTNFNFTVVGTNPVTLQTPSILRSVALFAGKAAQTTVSAPALSRTLGTNSPALTLPLTLTNSGGLPVAYSLAVTGASPVVYVAVNSTQPGGPVFNWRDISGVGQDISGSFTQLAAPKTARDEGIAGPYDLGFSFPFFSGAQSPGVFTRVYVSPNGFITFSPFAGDRSANTSLPGASAPTNLIGLFWDDLDVVSGSSARAIFVDKDPFAGSFTVQYQNVRFKGTTSTVTCQVILKSSGEILLQYRAMAVSNACTVGLQNAAANQGLQVAFNQNYLQTNFAVRLTPTRWLGLSANAGLVPKSSGDNVDVTLNPAGLEFGTYNATMLVTTDDPSQPVLSLPVQLSVTPIATWRQTHFGTADSSGSAADTADPDNDGLINILEYAFNTDPNGANPPPVSWQLAGGYLVVTFQRTHPAPPDITYLFEVTDNLASGTWQSGPSYTTQTVTDNLNGTETVTVTDLTAVASAPAHYLRVRISSP